MNRKELKSKAKINLKKHYLLFIFICAVASFIGTEFASSMTITREVGGVEKIVTNKDVINEEITQKDIETAKIEAKQQEKKLKEENASKVLGRTRGVFSLIRNGIDSGSFIISIVETISSISTSPNAAIIILILISFMVFFLVWFYIVNTYKVIMRRLFMEGRIYKKVPIQRFLYLFRIKKMTKASWTIFVETFYLALWNLTIIGGIIKSYSYFLVPFIVAENPDMKANDAITLSRKMMNGHKWECFKLEISFILWEALGLVTAGMSNIFYLNAYKIATYSEYYTKLRELSKENEIENTDLLNDKYLYEKASNETINEKYSDIIKLTKKDIKKIPKKKGIEGFINNYLGITTGSLEEEKSYEEEQLRDAKISQYNNAINGTTYPTRLYIITEKEKRKRIENINYLRRYRISSIILLFFIFSLIGWLWEVSLHLVNDGVFVNRGVMHGPWLPIYGTGGVLILIILNKFRKKPVVEFLTTITLCGIIEYFTSYFLEIAHNGQKWWDYSGYFLNLNGRICAEGLLVFGLGGLAIVYIVAPYLDNYINKINKKITIPICIILVAIFSVDHFYSKEHPNIGKGITDYKAVIIETKKETINL